jgi:hypothetical protein
MIGVLHNPDQTRVVEEFFELFKTPWEVYRPGCPYDAVIATGDHVPDVDARLLLIYGSRPKSGDGPDGVDIESSQPGGTMQYRSTRVPIYGSLSTLRVGSGATCAVEDGNGSPIGIQRRTASRVTLRLGYDLFREVEILLSRGQPVEHADVPALDLHIEMLRNWILSAGVPLLEIPPVPSGHAFAVCLTHDIDFVGIRRHKFDPTMWGFVYRSTFGALTDFLRGRISLGRLVLRWRAVLSLPLVYLGWLKDFWEPFDWYLRVEKGLPATYFLIPFKRRAGGKVPGTRASRRATAYDVTDISDWTATLVKEGCEVGVHGIDAWHRVESGREELARVASVAPASVTGIRMHWLLGDSNTASTLEQAGYAYDATAGYNQTIGYRNGTSQVFRPLDATSLLELPLHIQDGALFYPQQLGLTEPEAEGRCQPLIDNAGQFGGVLTLLWHDRSHGPERFWGGFYRTLIERLKASGTWFGTAGQVVGWFRQRRSVRFVRNDSEGRVKTRLIYHGEEINPPLVVRMYQRHTDQSAQGLPPGALRFVDVAWDGTPLELSDELVA